MMLQIRPDGVAHFAPVRVVHIVPESLVHYAPVEVVHYTPVCSQNKRFLANLLGNTANSYRILGDYKKAEELAFQSIAIKEALAKSSPLWNSLGIGYFNLGDIYLKQGATDTAQKYFDKSEDIFNSSGSSIGKGSVSLAKAELAKKKGDLASARKYAESARSIFAFANLGLYENKASEFLSKLAIN